MRIVSNISSDVWDRWWHIRASKVVGFRLKKVLFGREVSLISNKVNKDKYIGKEKENSECQSNQIPTRKNKGENESYNERKLVVETCITRLISKNLDTAVETDNSNEAEGIDVHNKGTCKPLWNREKLAEAVIEKEAFRYIGGYSVTMLKKFLKVPPFRTKRVGNVTTLNYTWTEMIDRDELYML